MQEQRIYFQLYPAFVSDIFVAALWTLSFPSWVTVYEVFILAENNWLNYLLIRK